MGGPGDRGARLPELRARPRGAGRLRAYPQPGARGEVWALPRGGRTFHERVTRIAAEEGLAFRLDLARPTNTLAVHRLLQLAGVRHLRPRAEDRFQRAYFTEGASFADPETLLRLATEAGLKEDDARRVLAGQAFTLQVRADEKEAAALGARGVPFFVFDRKEAVYGAQSTDAFVRALSSTASHGPSEETPGGGPPGSPRS